MQQFVTRFEGRAYKEKAALFLVVVDIGFHRDYIKAELCLGWLGEQSQQTNYYVKNILNPHSRHRICRYNCLSASGWLHCEATVCGILQPRCAVCLARH